MRSLIAAMTLLAVTGCDPGPSPSPDKGLTVEESATCVTLLWIDGTLTARPHGAFQMRMARGSYGHAAKGTCPDPYFVVQILPSQPGAFLTSAGPLQMGVDIAVDNAFFCAELTGAVEIDYLVSQAGRSFWQRTHAAITGQLSNGSCTGAYTVALPANSDVLEARIGVDGQFFGTPISPEIWIDN
jgi:hypothetical protein